MEPDDLRVASKVGDAVITESTGISGPWDSLFEDMACSEGAQPATTPLFGGVDAGNAGNAGNAGDASDAGDAGDGAPRILPATGSLSPR